MDENIFREQLKTDGFAEPELVEREPNLYNAEHVHDFDVSALIVSGELTVTTPDGATTCKSGDSFALNGGIVHTELYGPDGTQVLVGKRHH